MVRQFYLYACFPQRAEKPRWGGMYWDASYFRPACPQNLDEIRLDIPDYPSANVSEDCLYMNIFAPNVSTLYMCGVDTCHKCLCVYSLAVLPYSTLTVDLLPRPGDASPGHREASVPGTCVVSLWRFHFAFCANRAGSRAGDTWHRRCDVQLPPRCTGYVCRICMHARGVNCDISLAGLLCWMFQCKI